MLLEGSMIVIATTVMANTHPRVSFEGQWDEANFRLKSSKDTKGDINPLHNISEIEELRG